MLPTPAAPPLAALAIPAALDLLATAAITVIASTVDILAPLVALDILAAAATIPGVPTTAVAPGAPVLALAVLAARAVLAVLAVLALLNTSLFLPLSCVATVADCAPSTCVIAPCPELAKAWQSGQCSWPLSASAKPHCPHYSFLCCVGLLLLIVCPLSPLARSLQKPGSLGNAVGYPPLQDPGLSLSIP
jgi:hypothetical protein